MSKSRQTSSTNAALIGFTCDANPPISALSQTHVHRARQALREASNTAADRLAREHLLRRPPAMRIRPAMYDAVSFSSIGRNSQRSEMRCFNWRSDVSFKPIRQLRLAGQHHVQQLRGRRLDVAQQPDLFEQFVRDALRFVDDERAEHAGLVTLLQLAAQLEQEPRLRHAGCLRAVRTRGRGTRRTPPASASGCSSARRARRRRMDRRAPPAPASSCRCPLHR